MAGTAVLSIQDMAGNALEVEMPASETIAKLRKRISEEWSLDPKSYRLLVGFSFLSDDMVIESIMPKDHSCIIAQVVKYDPLPELGIFCVAKHTGVEIRPNDAGGSSLVKIAKNPDSNNVLLKHHIREPCFVEFDVIQSRDELSIGVTTEAERVEQTSGFANLRLGNTWIYSKHKSMPPLLFAGTRLPTPEQHFESLHGIREGDRVAVFVDPEERLVKFYNGGKCVASNLEYPLPYPRDDCPLCVYVMLDAKGDEVSMVRFGPGEPYPSTPEILEPAAKRCRSC